MEAEDRVVTDTACILLKTEGEARGTVADLAQEVSQASHKSKLSLHHPKEQPR